MRKLHPSIGCLHQLACNDEAQSLMTGTSLIQLATMLQRVQRGRIKTCLLYTSDAADE